MTLGILEMDMQKEVRTIEQQFSNAKHTLATRMRASRSRTGHTQESLALEAGTNQGVIQKIENDKSHMPRKIKAIAKALGVSPGWLLFGE